MASNVWTVERFNEVIAVINEWVDVSHLHAILCSQETMDKVFGEPATTQLMSRLARIAIDDWDYAVARRHGGWLFTWVSGISSLELDQFVPKEYVSVNTEPDETEKEVSAPEES
jgi:hypothetical protein